MECLIIDQQLFYAPVVDFSFQQDMNVRALITEKPPIVEVYWLKLNHDLEKEAIVRVSHNEYCCGTGGFFHLPLDRKSHGRWQKYTLLSPFLEVAIYTMPTNSFAPMYFLYEDGNYSFGVFTQDGYNMVFTSNEEVEP